jgi:hypothetical protein
LGDCQQRRLPHWPARLAELGAQAGGILVAVKRVTGLVPAGRGRTGVACLHGRRRAELGVVGAIVGLADRVVSPADRVVASPGPGIRVAPPALSSWRFYLNRASDNVATDHYSPQRGASASQVDAHPARSLVVVPRVVRAVDPVLTARGGGPLLRFGSTAVDPSLMLPRTHSRVRAAPRPRVGEIGQGLRSISSSATACVGGPVPEPSWSNSSPGRAGESMTDTMDHRSDALRQRGRDASAARWRSSRGYLA